MRITRYPCANSRKVARCRGGVAAAMYRHARTKKDSNGRVPIIFANLAEAIDNSVHAKRWG